MRILALALLLLAGCQSVPCEEDLTVHITDCLARMPKPAPIEYPVIIRCSAWRTVILYEPVPLETVCKRF